MSIYERLPEGWVETTLGILGEYINGYAFNDDLWSEKGRPIIRIQDLTGTRNTPNYFAGEIEEKYLVQPGDLLIAWSATLGAFIWHGPEAWLNQHIFKVISYVDRLFHYYLTQTVIDELYQKAHGSGMVHVTRGTFEATNVLLPPLPEQARIVAAIEQQFTRLDSAIASLRSAQAKAKQYRAALLKAAVEGELTKAWRAEHPVSETGAQLLARILDERRARWEEKRLAEMREKGKLPKNDAWKLDYDEPQGADVANLPELPELPEGWCWATVEQVSHFVRYGSSAKTSKDNIGVPVLRMGNIQDGSLDLNNLKYLPVDHTEFPALLLEKNDLLFNRTNSAELVGKTAVYRGEFLQCSYASYLICVRLSVDHLADFLCYYINSYYGKLWINAVNTQQAGQANVNGSKLQALPIPFPPLTEQAQIVAEVEARLSEIAKAEEMIEHSLRRAEQERQSILREAFAGRLVEQNPADEPASVLLERIREERRQRAEVAQVRRREEKMVMAQQRKNRQHRAPLYDVLVEAGGELRPEELYKRSDDQRKALPEQEREEGFYVGLDTEVTASLIREERPALDTILLQAVEQDDEALAEGEQEDWPQSEMRRPRSRDALLFDVEHLPQSEPRQPRSGSGLNVDSLPQSKSKPRRARKEVAEQSLWDEQ